MAQIVDGGSLLFDSLTYGKAHPGTQHFLAAQFENATNVLTQAGRQFFDGARELYERLNSSDAARSLRAAGRSVRSMWQLDEIRPMEQMADFQHAPLSMQRWLMAEPTVRRAYQEQRCDGYSDTYVDMDPNTLGPDHYDWRRVMDGVLVEDSEEDENGDTGWTATTYMEELLPDDQDLTFDEQVDIQHAWLHIKAAIINGGEDPTSRFNADLS